MERGILFTMLLNIVYYLALLTLNSKGFDIGRKVTSNNMMPHPAADTFESPRRFLCRIFSRDCERRGAKCSRRSCCKCECRGHLPNFLSLDKGCMSVNDIMKFPGTNCLYLLKNSGTTYVPTFSSHLDFINKDIVLQPRYQSMAGVLHGGTCKATNIYYFDRNGREKTLFENSCSEIFGIRTKETSSGVTQHLLRWTYQGWSSTRVWDKLKGKLLSMKIVCTNPVMSQKAGSCLLFKVAGSYDDTFAYTTTKSPSVCPTTPTPKIKTTTTATTTTTTMRTSTTMKPITTATTSTTKLPTTKSTLKTSTTKVKVIPPATSPDLEPATVISVEKTEEAPVTKAQPNKKGKSKGMKGRNKEQKKGTNWLVTGLIVAVAILLIILAASMSVLVRKKCKKRRSLNERNGQVAMNLMYDGEHGLNFQTSIPPRPSCDAGDDWKKYSDGNLYESIDNLQVKGATAASYPATGPYACADIDGAKVDIKDKSSKEEQPGERPHAKQNEYETPAIIIPKKQIYGTPVDETYADMSQGSSCEATPLFPEDKKYENLDDGANNRASVMTQPADEFYEEVDATKTTETMPLVSESYIVPDTIVKRK